MKLLKLFAVKRISAISTVLLANLSFGTCYAGWYPCPSAEEVKAEKYGPFQLCDGNPKDAHQLTQIYTNTIGRDSKAPYYGICSYYTTSGAKNPQLRISLNSPADVRGSDRWTLSSNRVCGVDTTAVNNSSQVYMVEFYVD